jgi:hypothetical protein
MVVHAHSLKDYIRDNFVPKPKEPPVRVTEEVILPCDEEVCPFCDAPLVYWYLSTKRTLVTIPYDVELQVVHKKCVNEECPACQQGRSFYNPTLDSCALPNHHLALDVTLLIGDLILQQHYTEKGVVKYLREEHGIFVTQPTVNKYKNICLALGQSILAGNPDTIRQALDQAPARVYSIDGVASNKSQTLFILREVISGVTLGSALLDAHDAETIHAFMEQVFQAFGRPDFLVGDGQTGLIGAAREYYPDIPYQYCHRHFLCNLGKALMGGNYEELKKSSTPRGSSKASAS